MNKPDPTKLPLAARERIAAKIPIQARLLWTRVAALRRHLAELEREMMADAVSASFSEEVFHTANAVSAAVGLMRSRTGEDYAKARAACEFFEQAEDYQSWAPVIEKLLSDAQADAEEAAAAYAAAQNELRARRGKLAESIARAQESPDIEEARQQVLAAEKAAEEAAAGLSLLKQRRATESEPQPVAVTVPPGDPLAVAEAAPAAEVVSQPTEPAS